MSKKFRIGTFNLLNLVAPNVKYYGSREYSQKNFKKKSEWIEAQLKRMNTDIIGFQEVFHESSLKEILSKSDKYKHYEIITANADGDSPRVALASRFPILKHERIYDFPLQLNLIDQEDDETEIPMQTQRFSRPVIKADIQIAPNFVVTVFVAHLKSKRPLFGRKSDRLDPSELAVAQLRSLYKRAAEACALRHLLIDHVKNSENPAILLGDLNDGGRSVTTTMITSDKPWMHRPPEIGYDEWHEIKRFSWASLFHNCKDIQARQSYQDMIYTHIHNGHYQCIDHIIVGNEFALGNHNRIGRILNVEAYNDHLIDETLSEDSIPVWQSDHGQLVATIELDKWKEFE
jgi:predicted extracellular nuclease